RRHRTHHAVREAARRPLAPEREHPAATRKGRAARSLGRAARPAGDEFRRDRARPERGREERGGEEGMVEILTHPTAVLAQTAAGANLSPGLEFLTHPAATFLAIVGLAALVAIVA